MGRITLPLLSLLTIVPSSMLVLGITSVHAQPVTTPQPLTPPPVTTILPSDTAGVLLINTTTQNWSSFNRFNPFPTEIDGPPGLPYFPTKINFKTDVQPWIGEWTALVLWPQTTNSPKKSTDSLSVMLAPVKNQDGVKSFLEKVKTNHKKPPIERQYKGITIIEWLPEKLPSHHPNFPTPPNPEPSPGNKPVPFPAPSQPVKETWSLLSLLSPENLTEFFVQLSQTETEYLSLNQPTDTTNLKQFKNSAAEIPEHRPPSKKRPLYRVPQRVIPGLAIAMLPGYLGISTLGEPLEKLIDSQTNLEPLTNNPKFQRLIENPQFGRSLAVGYLPISSLQQLLPLQPSVGIPLPLPYPLTRDFKTLETVLSHYETYIWIQEEGLRNQTNLYYQMPQLIIGNNNTNETDPVFSKLPANVYLATTTSNLKTVWKSAIAGLEIQPSSKKFLDQMRTFVRQWIGLDIDKDIIPWMDGKYGISFFPSNEGLFSLFGKSFPLGAAFIIQTSDRPAAEAALAKLDKFFAAKAGKPFNIISRNIRDQPAVSWEVQSAPAKNTSVLAHSWADNDTLMISTGIGPLALLNPAPNQSLIQNFAFKIATNPFPRPNAGYFYMNLGSTFALFNNFGPPKQRNSPQNDDFKRFLGTMRSLSFSTSATNLRQQVNSLLVLAPVNREQLIKPKTPTKKEETPLIP